jgi:hypothetical protein
MELLPIKPPTTHKNRLVGQVVHIDDFGNIITNLKRELVSGLGNRLEIKVGRKLLRAKFGRTFGEVPQGELVCYVGSAGTLELAKNQRNAAHELKVKIGDRFIIRR